MSDYIPMAITFIIISAIFCFCFIRGGKLFSNGSFLEDYGQEESASKADLISKNFEYVAKVTARPMDYIATEGSIEHNIEITTSENAALLGYLTRHFANNVSRYAVNSVWGLTKRYKSDLLEFIVEVTVTDGEVDYCVKSIFNKTQDAVLAFD